MFLADFNKWYQYYKQNETQAFCESKGEDFEGPSEGNFMLATQDAVIAAQNAVIAAQALGLGTCYIGDILENYEYHKALLQLPDYVYPVTMLTLGYYPENYAIPLRGRFDAKHIVVNETYQPLSSIEIDEMFESRDKLYTDKNKFGASNYAQMHYCFKTKSDFSKEMTRSVKLAIKEFSSQKIK